MQPSHSRFIASLALSILAGFLLIGCAAPPAAPAPQPNTPPPVTAAPGKPSAPPAGPSDAEDVVKAKRDLAQRTGVAVADIKTRSVEAVNWPDASLGCPQPDMMYAQVVTPGQRIVLEAGGQAYEYHSGGANVVFCPPNAERK